MGVMRWCVGGCVRGDLLAVTWTHGDVMQHGMHRAGGLQRRPQGLGR